VGDDSTNDDAENVVADLAKETTIRIDYKRNPVRLGQNGNTNSLFDRATTSHLMLLHDDDLLTPNAVEDLLSCWDEYPSLTAAYGKWYIMSHNGDVDLQASIQYNTAFSRIPERSGLQKNDWEVGLIQQFAGAAYMILTSVAQATRWRPAEVVGAGGEFDFGLRLGMTYHGFYFIDRYTMKYRKTETGSMSSSKYDDAAMYSYVVLEESNFSSLAGGEALRMKIMDQKSAGAMIQAIRHGQRKLAWRIYCSRHHGWRRRFSPGGVRRLLLLLFSFVKL
jgi:hypothetical protein